MNKQAEWIWYLGDFELYHHMKLSLSRRERGSIVPTFWKVFDCHRLVRFEKTFTLDRAETIRVTMDGVGYMMLGRGRKSAAGPIRLEAGTHTLAFIVGNADGVPSLLVEGETVLTDGSWKADAFEGAISPVGGMVLPAGVKPTQYELPCEEVDYVSVEKTDSGLIYDFGKETYIKLVFDLPAPGCSLKVIYGESMEEVLSDEHAVIREERAHAFGQIVLPATACRYARIVSPLEPQDVYGLYEYLPLEAKGSFESSDALLNQIYSVCDYTLRLNSRLFYLDGIKRDGWVWGGDAYQSFFFNYYIHYDRDIIKRTLLALRGGDPIVSHVDTIVDYSLYWLMSLSDYSLYIGDHAFIRDIYPRAVSLLEFCETRENESCLLEGFKTDWTFIDWADMDKRGALCVMQMLYCKALESMAKCSEIADHAENAAKYLARAKVLRAKIMETYWNAEKGAFVTTFTNGVKSEQVRRHANLFAIIYDFADAEMTAQIVRNVILNDEVPAITTPYFKFYELEALCKAGQTEKVTEIIRSYWGGMLALGATTFWEEYHPDMKGAEHYAMYGDPFDKSLCHAWGASPIYLFGRYYLGVRPVGDGYREFEVSPNNGGLERISGTVPVNGGSITITADAITVTIQTDVSGGYYINGNQRVQIVPGVTNTYKR